MAARRPLVRSGGKDTQLPAGDSIAGMPIYMRAYTQAGSALRLSLDINYALSAYKQDGSALKVQAVLNG